MTKDQRGVTRALADFAVHTAWEDLPATAQHATRRTFANSVGLAVGAARHPAVDIAVRTLSDVTPAGGFPVLARQETLTATATALVHGIAMHVDDFDDTHLRTVLHPGAPVVPAALAAGLMAGSDGRDVALAVALGVEVASRVGNALCPEHFDRGWHVTSTMGRLGSTVAAGRLLGLTSEQIVTALGFAATEVGGLTSALGTMTKSLHPGWAAADGIEAVVLAAAGVTAPPEPLAGRRGLGAVSSARCDFDETLKDLGTRWEVEDNAFKPYSCGIVSHPAIDTAIKIGQDRSHDPARLREVVLTVHPVVLDVMGVLTPLTGLQSKFSVYHCFAVGYLDGAAGPAQFSDRRALAEDVVAVRDRVRADADASICKDECRATVSCPDGTKDVIHVEHAVGSVACPMSDEQLRAKFRLVAEPIIGDTWGQVWELAIGVDSLLDVRSLTDAVAREVAE